MANGKYDDLNDFMRRWRDNNPASSDYDDVPVVPAPEAPKGEAPDIQPCEYGFPCNNCGYCH